MNYKNRENKQYEGQTYNHFPGSSDLFSEIHKTKQIYHLSNM